ncbi:MAG: hypothetical protein LJI21_00785 [Wolbachia endosymbiont of Menacanthus eurysternus]|nr:MAG: hypothetical protein LJI21_00785 [Wolbachia endosymbiont of Menacanthus eurysternus]
MKTKNFKGFNYYRLYLDKNGNLKLNNYNDIINARRAKVNLLLDSVEQDDINLLKINKALKKKFANNKKLLSKLDKEDQKIAHEEFKVFDILNNLDNLTKIKSNDLLEVSLLLSDLSFVEKNIVLSTHQNTDIKKLKKFFIEKKASGKKYSNKECKDFLNNIDRINTLIKLELESRIKN